AATRDGQRVEIDGTLSAMRPVLRRLPATLAMEARLDPAPLAQFSSLKASGEFRLNANDSYQIRDGRFEIGDQAFSLDALYRPGARHHVFADLAAERIDLGAFGVIGQSGAGDGGGPADAGEADLSMLAGFDADISMAIDELSGDGIEASDVLLAATLRDGSLAA